MNRKDLATLEPDDLLIFKSNGSRLPIIDIDKEQGSVVVNFCGRKVKRSLNQLNRLLNHYTLIKKGEQLSKDVVFYDPVKDEIVELSAGSVYLGELE